MLGVRSLRAPVSQIPCEKRRICTLFDGVKLATNIKTEVKQNIIDFQYRHKQDGKEHFKPKLIAIAVGNIPASEIYLKKKEEAAKFCGLDFNKVSLKENISEIYLRDLIKSLNRDKTVSGIIVQLPLPSHMSEINVCNTVSSTKDVDGFTQTNLGKLMQNVGENSLIPCTALAVKRIVASLKIK